MKKTTKKKKKKRRRKEMKRVLCPKFKKFGSVSVPSRVLWILKR